MAKVYFPISFKNEDVPNLIAALTLALGRKPDWSPDERGFWVEVGDDEAKRYEDVVSTYLQKSS